jgi:hypothetical protein
MRIRYSGGFFEFSNEPSRSVKKKWGISCQLYIGELLENYFMSELAAV